MTCMADRPSVVVIGGGIAGLAAARNLADRAVDVTLIEREPRLGGNARAVCCKAIDGACQLCGGCLLGDQISAVTQHPGIQLLLQTFVSDMRRRDDGYTLTAAPSDGPSVTLSANAVLLATGFDHIDALHKGPYGYGILPAVTTGKEMERRITAQGQGAYDNMGLRSIAFVQCVGSRDEHVGRGYCSQVCCRYAVRLARLLKSRQPDLQVTIFKMDIQYTGRDMLPAWRAAQAEGIRIVAGLPAVIRRDPDDPQRVAFLVDDVLAGETRQEGFDLVVLSTGIMPRSDTAQMASQWDLGLDRFGFLSSQPDAVSTRLPGVFLAGACQAPRSIAESLAHAQQAAEACYRHIVSQPTAVQEGQA
jgi:heterodisulfide reductase subunit A